MLERHLEHYLRDRGGLRDEDRAWLHGDTVAVHLARHGGLAETVRLARELAGHLADPPVPDRHRRLDRLLDAGPAPAPPAAPAARARRLLQCSPDVGHWSQVIALAVFDGNRPQVVADAAGRLARRLAPADPRADSAWPPAPAGAGPPLRRMALVVPDQPPGWRPGPARGDWLERAGAEPFDDLKHVILFNRTPTRRIRFKDPALRAAVLDQVWDELDELRGPVGDWLDELGDATDPEVQEQTAEAVAYLASHGFSYVLERVVVPWTRRGRPARDAAALALGVLARDDGRFTGPVLALLSQWARFGGDPDRETAAMAYGQAVGLEEPTLALRELRALAAREGTEVPVAEALFELFRRSRHAEVLEALQEWTTRPRQATWSPAERWVLRTGLKAFLLTTRVYDEAPPWPSLVTLAEASPELRERIVELWRRALAHDELGEVAGWTLCAWAREADVQAAAAGGEAPELVRVLGGLTQHVAAGGKPDRGRVRQALNRCATAYDDPSAVARELAVPLVETVGDA